MSDYVYMGFSVLTAGCLAWQAIAARQPTADPRWRRQRAAASLMMILLLCLFGLISLVLIDSWLRIGGLLLLIVGLRQLTDAIRTWNGVNDLENGASSNES